MAARPRATSGVWPSRRAGPFGRSSTWNSATKSFFWDTSDMAHLVIEGGRRLSGRVTVAGNKNAALPLLAACLLTTETCEIRNLPRIRDVAVMIDLLRSLGAEVDDDGSSVVRVTSRNIHASEPDATLVGKL